MRTASFVHTIITLKVVQQLSDSANRQKSVFRWLMQSTRKLDVLYSLHKFFFLFLTLSMRIYLFWKGCLLNKSHSFQHDLEFRIHPEAKWNLWVKVKHQSNDFEKLLSNLKKTHWLMSYENFMLLKIEVKWETVALLIYLGIIH